MQSQKGSSKLSFTLYSAESCDIAQVFIDCYKGNSSKNQCLGITKFVHLITKYLNSISHPSS